MQNENKEKQSGNPGNGSEGNSQKPPVPPGQDKDKDHEPPVKDEHKKTITLLFIVNGSATPIESELNWELKVAVELALQKTGNSGRPLTDWVVKYENQTLNLDEKIHKFKFPEKAELFVSLNAGHGGHKSCLS